MIAWAAASLAQVPPEEPAPMPLEGFVLEPVGGGTGVQLATSAVVGGDGATTAVAARGRLRLGDAVLVVGLPFAVYRRADDTRDAGLGNLTLGGWLATGDRSALGVVGHLPLGRAWTWVNEVEELWPGVGADVIYRTNTVGLGPSERITVLARVAGGLHTSGGIEPIPGFYAKVALAGGADVALTDHVGLAAESSFAWWDTSPFDVAALARADLGGLRARGGVLVPLASWAGGQPAPVPAGVREATVRVDLCTQW